MLQISTKSTARFLSNGTQRQKFPIRKSRLSSSHTIISVTVCAQSGRRLHGHMRVVEYATVELLDFVEICNIYVGKIIIKAVKRICNSGKICRSYLLFGVTFLEHGVLRSHRKRTQNQHASFLKHIASLDFNPPQTDSQKAVDHFYDTTLSLLNQFYPQTAISVTFRDRDYTCHDCAEIISKLCRKN